MLINFYFWKLQLLILRRITLNFYSKILIYGQKTKCGNSLLFQVILKTNEELSFFLDYWWTLRYATLYQFNRPGIPCSFRDPTALNNNPSSVSFGVPHGSNLEPLLYALLIKDLTNVVKCSKCILYADVCKLYESITIRYDYNKKLLQRDNREGMELNYREQIRL